MSIGETNPFPTPSGDWQPKASTGMHSCLYDNIWGKAGAMALHACAIQVQCVDALGTNYIMWYPYEPADADIQYRWQLVF